MSRHDPAMSLLHVRNHSPEAITMIEGLAEGEFNANRTLNLAVTRLVEIIGEAAGRVHTEIQNQHSQIPWVQITGMRNRLIHGYDAVDLGMPWSVVTDDLPLLFNQLNSIIDDS